MKKTAIIATFLYYKLHLFVGLNGYTIFNRCVETFNIPNFMVTIAENARRKRKQKSHAENACLNTLLSVKTKHDKFKEIQFRFNFQSKRQ